MSTGPERNPIDGEEISSLRFDEMTEGERYLLWGVRRWLKGLTANCADHWSCVWSAFAKDYGTEDGRRAVGAIERMIRILARGARTRFAYHQPCCGCVAPSECLLLGALSACQHGDFQTARDLTRRFLRDDEIGDFLQCGSDLGRVMAAHGHVLAYRPAAPASVPRAATFASRHGSATIH